MGWLKDKIEMAKQAESAEERAPVKPAASKKKGPKKSLLERAGIKVEREATPDEQERKDREKSIVTVWEYIRRQIDLGCHEYFAKGESEKLREFVGAPAYEALTTHLDQLRNAGIYWSQPERKTRTNARVEVVSDKADRFVVQERFTDTSELKRLADGATTACDGEERVIRATVEVKGGQHYRLLSVIKVSRAEL